MIYFHTVVGSHLKHGFNDANERALLLKGTSPSPDSTLQDISRHQVATLKPHSMCGWAFELLRSDPVCLASDFRSMFSRYTNAFGNQRGRCIRYQASSCRGDDSAHCQRFRGMKSENQSAHDELCQGYCDRLIWDEKSWPIVKHQPRLLQFLTSGVMAKEGGLRRVMGSIAVYTAGIFPLLDHSTAIPIGWTRPVFQRIMSSVVKRS